MGDLAGAESLNARTLRNSVEGPVVPFELNSRAQAALIAVGRNHLETAQAHVQRCREIIACGENFRGLLGRAELAQAAVHGASGDFDRGEPHLEAAIVIFRRYDLAWEEAAARFTWGELLRTNGKRDRAAEQFAQARQLYERHGAGAVWLERIAQASPGSGHRAPGSRDLSPPSASTFCCEGDYWTVEYGGRTLRIRDSKGVHYIAQLLAHPGEKLPAQDLMNVQSRLRPARYRDGSRGEASRSHERARLAVTKAIKGAVAKIRGIDPAWDAI
jgi:hypothetical protein